MKEGKRSFLILKSETRAAENQGVDCEKVRREDASGGNSSQDEGNQGVYCRIRFDGCNSYISSVRMSTVVPLNDPCRERERKKK